MRVDIIDAEVTSQQSKCLLLIDWLPSIKQCNCLSPFFFVIPVDWLQQLNQNLFVFGLAVSETPDDGLVFCRHLFEIWNRGYLVYLLLLTGCWFNLRCWDWVLSCHNVELIDDGVRLLNFARFVYVNVLHHSDVIIESANLQTVLWVFFHLRMSDSLRLVPASRVESFLKFNLFVDFIT